MAAFGPLALLTDTKLSLWAALRRQQMYAGGQVQCCMSVRSANAPRQVQSHAQSTLDLSGTCQEKACSRVNASQHLLPDKSNP